MAVFATTTISGSQAASTTVKTIPITVPAFTGRVERTDKLLIKVGSTTKSTITIKQSPKDEFITITSLAGPNGSEITEGTPLSKDGGVVTIKGKSNVKQFKSKMAALGWFSDYATNWKIDNTAKSLTATASGTEYVYTAVPGDPGASAEFAFECQVTVDAAPASAAGKRADTLGIGSVETSSVAANATIYQATDDCEFSVTGATGNTITFTAAGGTNTNVKVTSTCDAWTATISD